MYNQAELQAAVAEGLNARGALIADGGTKISALLAESLAAVKTARASPEWRAYTDFVAGIVIDGLCAAAVAALKFLTAHVRASLYRLGTLGLASCCFQAMQAV